MVGRLGWNRCSTLGVSLAKKRAPGGGAGKPPVPPHSFLLLFKLSPGVEGPLP